MTFKLNYSDLGETDRLRVPVRLIPHLKNVIERYNHLKKTRGEEFLQHVITVYEEELRRVS